jgi:hypothetical protein
VKLTRRDAIAAIVGGGMAGYVFHDAAAGGDGHPNSDGADVGSASGDPRSPGLAVDEIATLVSVAEVVYPSEVSVTAGFVSKYVDGMGATRRERLRDAIGELNDQSRSWYGTGFGSATRSERDALLRRLGVDAVQPRPEGTVAERVRYHVVNGLLYALFTTPKGSRLLGIEEPKGHPGGYAAYRTGGSE